MWLNDRSSAKRSKQGKECKKAVNMNRIDAVAGGRLGSNGCRCQRGNGNKWT